MWTPISPQRGLTAANHIDNVYDANLSLGGPIRHNKLWFFGTFRRWGANSFVANTFNPDGTQALDDNRLTNTAIRTTWQVTQKNKVNFLYSHGAKWRGHRRGNNPTGTVFVDPVATVVQTNPRNFITQVKWYSTLTNQLMVEAGAVMMPVDYNLAYQPEVGPTNLAELDLITGVLSKAAPWDTVVTGTMETYAASVSYVPGSHNLKAGFQARGGFFQEAFRVNEDILLRFRNGAPDSVLTYNTPVTRRDDLRWELGVYLQDSFTYKRLTLNPGVRFDHMAMGWPEQSAAGRHVRAGAHVPGGRRARQLELDRAAFRCGVRRLRKREDGAERKHQQVHEDGRHEPGLAGESEPAGQQHALVDGF